MIKHITSRHLHNPDIKIAYSKKLGIYRADIDVGSGEPVSVFNKSVRGLDDVIDKILAIRENS